MNVRLFSSDLRVFITMVHFLGLHLSIHGLPTYSSCTSQPVCLYYSFTWHACVTSAFGFALSLFLRPFHPWSTNVTPPWLAWVGLRIPTVDPLPQLLAQIQAARLRNYVILLPPLLRPRPLSAPLEANTISNDLGTTSHTDTYSAPALPDVPFPTEPNPTYNFFHRSHFSSRVVHQIHFKIITHSNNTRELFIEEIPTSGLSKGRDPEHYFYGLSGNWEWSLRTADYWRHHFEIPLVHGHHPFHNVPIETTSPTEAPRLTTKIQELAKQLSATLTAAMASGEINDTWRMVEGMSFREAIQILQLEANFPSE